MFLFLTFASAFQTRRVVSQGTKPRADYEGVEKQVMLSAR